MSSKARPPRTNLPRNGEELNRQLANSASPQKDVARKAGRRKLTFEDIREQALTNTLTVQGGFGLFFEIDQERAGFVAVARKVVDRLLEHPPLAKAILNMATNRGRIREVNTGTDEGPDGKLAMVVGKVRDQEFVGVAKAPKFTTALQIAITDLLAKSVGVQIEESRLVVRPSVSMPPAGTSFRSRRAIGKLEDTVGKDRVSSEQVGQTKPGHDVTFKMKVTYQYPDSDKSLSVTGRGTSKNKAEDAAATNILRKLGIDTGPDLTL